MEKKTIPFTGAMSPFERAVAIGYIPVHVYLLPRLLLAVSGERTPDPVTVNAVCYVTAALVLLLCLRRYFRREFDALCDYGPGVLPEVLKHYGVLLLCNMAVGAALILAGQKENPNNAAVASLAGQDMGKTAAAAVFLAPIAEEAMFRGGLFALLRRRSRLAAYGVSMLLFALYHVWSFALSDPTAWLYLLQYLPAAFLLAHIYEKTNSLWSAIFLHMTVNGLALLAISALGAYA